MKRTPIVLAAAAVPAVAATSASAAVTPARSAHFMAGATARVTGIKVPGYDGKAVHASVSTTAAGAALRVYNGAGTREPFGDDVANTYSGSSVQFIGTQDEVNAARASLSIPLPASTNSKVVLKTTVFENSGAAFFAQDPHFYEYVPGKVTGTAALAAAEASREFGLAGYLASITSEAENDVVSSTTQGDAGVAVRDVWIGAQDADVEGDRRWKGGPDNGVQFWKGCDTANGGAPFEGHTSSWADREPNNGGSDAGPCFPVSTPPENCAVTNRSSRRVRRVPGSSLSLIHI